MSQDSGIELNAQRLLLAVLSVSATDADRAISLVADRLSKAPQLLKGKSVIVSFGSCGDDCQFVRQVVEGLKALHVFPAALAGVDMSVASELEIGFMSKAEMDMVAPAAPAKEVAQHDKAHSSNMTQEMVFKGSVRSGMKLEAKGRSVIIFGNINPGGEVLADGSVYVYGKVMGRIHAGLNNELDNRVVWQEGVPELLRIGQKFVTADDFSEKLNHHSKVADLGIDGDICISVS